MVLLLLMFWIVVLRYMTLIPPFEGSDEREHFGYITQLRGGAFPDPRTSLDNLAVQASAQAPLHYILVTLWSRLAPDYDWDGELPDNPWRNYVRPVIARDNPNYTLFGPDQLPFEHNPNIGVSLIWTRFISAFDGMLMIALAYITARLLLGDKWAFFVTLVFGFNSVLVQIFALLTNDAAAILFGIACTYRVAVLLKRDLMPRSLILTGVVVGLGTLTKLSVLVFVPVAGLVVLLRAYYKSSSVGEGLRPSRLTSNALWREVIYNGLLLAIPILLIGGPWYLYQGIAYGDPLGIQPHLRMNWAHIPARSLALAFQQDGFTPLLTLWSGYAWGLVTTGAWVYIVNLVLLAVGIIGIGRAAHRLWNEQRLVIIALALIWAGVFAAYLRWWTMFTFMNGRHLLPGYLALVILVALGIQYGWRARVSRLIRLVFATLTVFIAWVIVGNVTLVEAFTTITFSPEQAPSLMGTPMQFGEARFLGYRVESATIHNRQHISVMTCWSSLQQDAPLPMPYAFSLHLIGDDGAIYAGRESYTGMGKYTLWKPNAAFCDRFDLIQRQDFLPARGYRIAVSLFDPQTTQPIPDDAGIGPFVGWLASSGVTLSADERDSAQYDFGGVLLLDYSLNRTSDGFTLDLQWGTSDWQARPVTLFLHVTDAAGNLVGPPDAPLGGETYPAFLWGDNERTYEHTVNVSLPAGEYTVYAGLYDSQTMERLPIMQARGKVASDGRALLTWN
jgi:hypothetical protein